VFGINQVKLSIQFNSRGVTVTNRIRMSTAKRHDQADKGNPVLVDSFNAK